MDTLLRNLVAVVVGIAIGVMVNASLIAMSGSLIASPPGVDPASTESLARGIHLFEPKHFLMPFLAHALGTLTGALVAYVFAGSRNTTWSFAIGGLFLLGGVAAAAMIPAPAWFIATDLLLAYVPMAWLACRLGGRIRTAGARRP